MTELGKVYGRSAAQFTTDAVRQQRRSRDAQQAATAYRSSNGVDLDLQRDLNLKDLGSCRSCSHTDRRPAPWSKWRRWPSKPVGLVSGRTIRLRRGRERGNAAVEAAWAAVGPSC